MRMLILPWSTLVVVGLQAQTAHYVVPFPVTGSNYYAKIQDAVDAAGDGDTIYVYPGGYAETLTITDTLIIIGAGRHQRVFDPLDQILTISSTIASAITVKDGAHLELIALDLRGVNVLDSASITMNQVTSSGSHYFLTTGNVIVNNTYLSIVASSSSNPRFHVLGVKAASFRNSIIYSNVTISATNPSYTSPIFFVNCHIEAPLTSITNTHFSSTVIRPISAYNSGSSNGAVPGVGSLEVTGSYCAIIGSNTSPGAHAFTNSLWGLPNTLYTSTATLPNNYCPAPNSPLIGAGVGGTDIGVCGGSAPIVPGFFPSIPRVRQLDVVASPTPAAGMDVHVNLKSQ